MTAAGRQALTVIVEASPERPGALRPATWLRACLVEVLRVTGCHSDGWTFRFACDADRHPDAGHVWGTVWEPIHAGRPIHHWLEVLVGRPPQIGEAIDLASLLGADVDIYCEEETEADPATGRSRLQVVDLRPAYEREDD